MVILPQQPDTGMVCKLYSAELSRRLHPKQVPIAKTKKIISVLYLLLFLSGQAKLENLELYTVFRLNQISERIQLTKCQEND